MSEMVERVASAIRGVLWSEAFPGTDLRQREQFAEAARAAIEAMREPTQSQYDALVATDKMWRKLNSTTVYQTYIDGALK